MKSDIIQVNNISIERMWYKGIPVATFEMIDLMHGFKEDHSGRTFQKNKKRWILNEDYYRLTYQQLREILSVENPSPNGLTLVTESGYAMLVKVFGSGLV